MWSFLTDSLKRILWLSETSRIFILIMPSKHFWCNFFVYLGSCASPRTQCRCLFRNARWSMWTWKHQNCNLFFFGQIYFTQYKMSLIKQPHHAQKWRVADYIACSPHQHLLFIFLGLILGKMIKIQILSKVIFTNCLSKKINLILQYVVMFLFI